MRNILNIRSDGNSFCRDFVLMGLNPLSVPKSIVSPPLKKWIWIDSSVLVVFEETTQQFVGLRQYSELGLEG